MPQSQIPSFAVAIAIVAGLAPAALAQRPVLTGEATYGAPGGSVLVHYATSGVDAVPVADTNADGTPDFVATIADTAAQALDHFATLGFRAPLSDGALGGDGRIDIYLRDLNAADGNAGNDSCDGDRCVGFVAAENDYTGFGYPSVLEGIRSVVPHELFHLVQKAYASSQPATWSEGSAVWAVENLYGADNSDFERFLPSFVTRSYRPFERPVGGFGDAYPYGAALWPYFLEHRFGVATVVAAWAASEQAGFLDATDTALRGAGSTTNDAWIEFTRWNLFTGARASGGPYPDARAWPEVPREPAIAATGTIYVEGLSARYVPITIASRQRIAATPTGGIRIAAWIVRDGGGLDEGFELAAQGTVLATMVEAGSYTLVVTGLSRGTITTAVDISVGEPLPNEGDDTGGGGGCAATRASHPLTLIFFAALTWRLGGRRRAFAHPERDKREVLLKV